MLSSFKNIFAFGQFIKLSRREGNLSCVAQLELANPKKKNALSLALLDEVTLFLFSSILQSKILTNNTIFAQLSLEAVKKDTSVLELI